jgi:YgiT-type zinc finger domain-containing protein
VRCTICRGDLAATGTDIPFKVTETAIVIIKSLPVLACERCPEYLLEDEVLNHVDAILARADRSVALVIIHYDQARWDIQLERDVQAGRLDAMAEQVLHDHALGKTTAL